jgi:hypothetical protein
MQEQDEIRMRQAPPGFRQDPWPPSDETLRALLTTYVQHADSAELHALAKGIYHDQIKCLIAEHPDNRR